MASFHPSFGSFFTLNHGNHIDPSPSDTLFRCIMSGLLSVDGKKILHMDRNDYYGAAGLHRIFRAANVCVASHFLFQVPAST
jgi:hypothetical protein